MTRCPIVTKGKWSGVEHFDSKAHVEEYIRSIGIPASFFMPGFYMSNFPGALLRPNPNSEAHEFILAAPWPRSTAVPLFDAAADTGKFAKAMLLNREKVLGKRVYAATDYYTTDDILRAVEEAFPKKGKGAHFVQVGEVDYKKALAGAGMPKRAQDEMYENMMFMDEFGYYGKASLDESHAVSVVPLMISWCRWMDADVDLVLDSRREADDVQGIHCESAHVGRSGLRTAMISIHGD